MTRHVVILLSSLALCAVGTSCSKKDDKGKAGKPKASGKKGNAGKGKTPKGPAGSGAGGMVEAGTKIITNIDVGAYTSCATFKDGTVRCWGGNLGGSLGVGKDEKDLLESYVPVEVADAKGAKQLWASASDCWSGSYSEGAADTVCTQDKAGAVKCWGRNKGAFGAGGSNKPVATTTTGLKGILHMDSECGTACAVNADNTASCWGSGVFGQIGHGKTESSVKVPTKVKGLAGATQVGCGQNHCCALKSDGTVDCWGYGLPGGQVTEPKNVPGIAGAKDLGVMQNAVCAVDKAGVVSCFGSGHGYKKAEPVKGATDVTQLDAQTRVACAVKKDKTVVCWGLNRFGQLGRGTLSEKEKDAAPVKGLKNAVKVAVSDDYACALTGDNKVMCWGKNSRGQLGNGTITDSSTPVEVKGLTAKSLAKAGPRPLALPSDKKAFKPEGTPPKECAKQTGMLVHIKGKPQQFLVRHAKIKGSWTAKLGGATGYRLEFQNYDNPPQKYKPMARGGQLIVKLGLEHWVIEKNKEGKERPVAKPLDKKGEYSPNYKAEYRTSGAGILDRHKKHFFNDGTIKLTHLSDKWVCGDVNLSHKRDKHSLKGTFALQVPAKPAKK